MNFHIRDTVNLVPLRSSFPIHSIFLIPNSSTVLYLLTRFHHQAALLVDLSRKVQKILQNLRHTQDKTDYKIVESYDSAPMVQKESDDDNEISGYF